MIRANLLPRPKERFTLFGIEVDAEYARQSLAGVAFVVLVAAVGCGIERMRLDRSQVELRALDTALDARAGERAEATRLALDVARYQEFAREAASLRRSGADAAVGIVRIGNAVPGNVWLDALERDPAGYELSGESASLDAVGGTMLRLAGMHPSSRAELVSLDAHDPNRPGIRFSARLDGPPASSRR